MQSSFLAFALLLLPATPAGTAHASGTGVGTVYVAANAAGANEVLAFSRGSDGRLAAMPAAYATGGDGTGAGLGNQGGLVLAPNGDMLFVVNAGSDEVSVFRRLSDGSLELVDVASSGGTRPISLTLHGDLLYVLNAGGAGGGTDEITGFRIGAGGELSPVPGSTRGLSATSVAPAQVGFAPGGDVLVVAEKATSMLTTFVVDRGGLPGTAMPQPSAGTTPFGFAFARRGILLVSEAFGGAADASALSSYAVRRDGTLDVVVPSAPTTESAACWVAVSRGGRFAYTTNAGSMSISGFAVAPSGALERLDEDGVTGPTGATPLDLDFSDDGRFLYSLDAGSGQISAFRFAHATGALAPLQTVDGLPAGANGLAAR